MTRSALAPGLSSDMPAIDRSLAGVVQHDLTPAAPVTLAAGEAIPIIWMGPCVGLGGSDCARCARLGLPM